MNQALRTDVCTGFAAFDALRPEWEALLDTYAEPPFHLRHAWYRAYHRCLAPAGEGPVCVVLRRGQSCRGIFCLSPAVMKRKSLPCKVLAGPAGSDLSLNDVLLADGESLRVWWPAVCAALRRARIRWLGMHLQRVPADAHIARLAQAIGWDHLWRPQGATSFIDCNTSVTDLAARYSTRLTRILRKGGNGLGRMATPELVTAVAADAREAAFGEVLRLESSGWKGNDGERSALAHDASLQAFYRELFTGPHALPQAEINLLRLDGVAVAAQLCVLSGGTRSLLKIAYQQELQKFSPGSVLLDAVLRRSCATRDAQRLSFVTSEAWMSEWGASATPVGDLWLLHGRILHTIAALLIGSGR